MTYSVNTSIISTFTMPYLILIDNIFRSSRLNDMICLLMRTTKYTRRDFNKLKSKIYYGHVVAWTMVLFRRNSLTSCAHSSFPCSVRACSSKLMFVADINEFLVSISNKKAPGLWCFSISITTFWESRNIFASWTHSPSWRWYDKSFFSWANESIIAAKL